MKRLALLAVPILAVTFTAGGITASAQESETKYPEDEEFVKTLTFSSLTDYAIEDDLFAFADGKLVKVYTGGNYSEYEFDGAVTAVKIEKGVIYCGSGGTAYSLPDKTELKDCTFSQTSSEILFGGLYYFTDTEGLIVFNSSTKEYETHEGEYFNLKQYGDKVYAICDNILHEFTGTANKPLDKLKYTVDADEVEITIGQADRDLKKYNAVTFVKIQKDSYMTEIDLEDIKGEHFVPLDIVKADENTTALLLCESGNAAIISIRDKAYAVLKEKIESRTSKDNAHEGLYEAQITGGGIYASPFISSGTAAKSNVMGLTVTVVDRIENSVLESVFYEVEYGEGETGFVAEGLLTSVTIKDDKPPQDIPDPKYTEKNDTKTILIILAVVLLVLAAIVYISHITSKGKKKDKKKKEEDAA